MRVVAGELGGRRLVVPAGDALRPTSELVRAAIFNSLGSLGAVDGAVVVDLFAGSGALGIEALSRGAERAVFVDHDRRAVDAIRANVAALGLDGRAEVVRRDVLSWVSGSPEFDLALIDPPYRFAAWTRLLSALTARVAVCESERPIEPPEGWRITKSRRHGGTVVTLLAGGGATET
jgi:16S rRNA (guanine966-N2)-methyltransferase